VTNERAMSSTSVAALDETLGESVQWSGTDDQAHAPGPEQDWTETAWWSFNVPERALGGWLYVAVRPNIRTVAGGAFVYDPSGWLPWDARYYEMLHYQALPDPLDLRDVEFATGVSMRCLEPGSRYEVGYRLGARDDFTASLVFEGISDPVPYVSGEPPFAQSSHFDQQGHLTGTITLDGETIAVDCIACRDRSWGSRPEIRAQAPPLTYCQGASGTRHSFLAFCMPSPSDPGGETEHLFNGYLLRDGRVARLAELTRRNVRDAATGWVDRIELEGADREGRALWAVGTVRSRMPFFFGDITCMCSQVEWTLGDSPGSQEPGWGEDQDVCPQSRFADRPRAGRPPRA
jgi:hypothetical protein